MPDAKAVEAREWWDAYYSANCNPPTVKPPTEEQTVCLLVRQITKMLAAYAEHVLAGRWQSVKDNPPAHYEWVHVIVDGVFQTMPCRLEPADFDENTTNYCWCWLDDGADSMPFEKVQLWCPMPAPPPEVKNK